MSEFELVTGPTFTINNHQLWMDRGWRNSTRRMYRLDRARWPVAKAKRVTMEYTLGQHWYWKGRAE